MQLLMLRLFWTFTLTDRNFIFLVNLFHVSKLQQWLLFCRQVLRVGNKSTDQPLLELETHLSAIVIQSLNSLLGQARKVTLSAQSQN